VFPSPKAAGHSGGVNIPGSVGSVSGDIVGRDKIGLDEKEVGRRITEAQRPVNEQLAALAAQIARENGVETAPLQAILIKLGEAGVPDYLIPTRLDAAADELLDLRAQLARLTNDRPEFALLRSQALAHIDRGEFDAARALISGAAERPRVPCAKK
jgi:hypothetical protein